MDAKKVLPLVIAVVMAAGAGFMVLKMIHKTGPQGAQVKMPQIVVAKHDIEAGAVLTDDDLMLGTIGTGAVPETAFRNPSEVIGRVPTVPLISGQALTSVLLAPRGTGGGLQSVVPIGMRAMTLEINEFSGVAGYIVPGSHVDILQSMRDLKTGASFSRTIAQNVKVTTIGQRHGPSDKDDGNASAHSATVLVTPQQAELLELASANGHPRLTLRSSNDLTDAAVRGATLADLQGTLHGDGTRSASDTIPASSTTRPSDAQAAASDTWTVQVIRGDSNTEAKFDIHHKDSLEMSDTPQAPLELPR